MKTDILKFKAVMLILALACANQPLPGMIPPPQETVTIENLCENEFLEVIVFRITTDAVEAILELIDMLTDKRVPQETLDSIIKRCRDLLAHINGTILVPLKVKLDKVKATSPQSPFCPILEKTYKLA